MEWERAAASKISPELDFLNTQQEVDGTILEHPVRSWIVHSPSWMHVMQTPRTGPSTTAAIYRAPDIEAMGRGLHPVLWQLEGKDATFVPPNALKSPMKQQSHC